MKDRIVELKDAGYTHKQIMAELGCCKSVICYHLKNKGKSYKNDKVTTDVIIAMQELYDEVKSTLIVAKHFDLSKSTVLKYVKIIKVYVDPKEINRNGVYTFRQKMKAKLIDYKGGKCEKCGYSKCNRALTFHHIDPTQKDFNISHKSWSFENLKNELDKCLMLCMNCHMEEHDKIDKQNQISKINIKPKERYDKFLEN